MTFSRIIGLPIDHGKDYQLREFPPHFAGEFATPFLASSAAHNQRFTTGGGAGRLLSRSDPKAVLLRSSRLFPVSPATFSRYGQNDGSAREMGSDAAAVVVPIGKPFSRSRRWGNSGYGEDRVAFQSMRALDRSEGFTSNSGIYDIH
ncbi:MAG: hypothetical protein ACJ8ES_16640 [Xanthobacteraceae bacterium]